MMKQIQWKRTCCAGAIKMSLIEHTLVALVILALVGWLTKNWWAAAALPSGYFIGREVAQAEYRWIETFGGGLRANMPWHAVFDLRLWESSDQIADWLGPVAACIAVAVWADRYRK
ncbi:hypothetical protein OIK40_01560 [Erythrobacter sp. sf7]|uniref:Uncharacterized protein n=1 Tax=Erythrobacter fulvus TaxID=2987523 RepID=A0ABT5JMA7_9SPHN|nr:hypothetical protein [Erythrobacter fulvus]MDC8753325.1 hypothetical protein [Erythrobacter fulvus]